MAVTYRFATPDDADALGVVHTRSWQAAYAGLIDAEKLAALDPAERADGFRGGLPADEQRRRGVTWIVAEDDGAIVGHVLTQLHEGKGYMHLLYLAPEAWGRGIGHMLHDMGLRGLHRLGVSEVRLKVLDGNDRAIRFYERHGWQLTGERSTDEFNGIEVTDQEMRIDLDRDLLVANRQYWNDKAAFYDTYTGPQWNKREVSLGIFGLPGDAIFPEVDGRDVVELGCGTAYVSNWCLQRGARSAVGLDNSPGQLATAQRLIAEHDSQLQLVMGDAHRPPFPDNSFDVAINEYGAAIWCDPRIWIPEAARILRPGGTLWFLGNSVQMMLCAPEFEDVTAGRTLLRPQRGMHTFEWIDTPNIEFHVSHGEMISILTGAGFVVEALHELYAPADAETPFGFVDGEWADQWPSEEVWVARLS